MTDDKTSTKSYAINFICLHKDKSRSNPFRVYDFQNNLTPAMCYDQALEYMKESDDTIESAVIVNMQRIE